MKKNVSFGLLLAAGALSAVLGAPRADAGVRVYVRVPPPPAVVEVRPAAPSPEHVWVEGYHNWNGNAYVWVPGRWETAPRHHARWIAGHWRHSPRGYYWVPGHWR
jgi:hypothetical protein